jgi:predicted acetyltransferase
VTPGEDHLPSYLAALRRSWSPDTQRQVEASTEELARFLADPLLALEQMDDVDPVGRLVTLQDGSHVPRLPSRVRWMWDGEFCGSINLRWAPGTPELPDYCLGHIGYAVVPWKQGRGYATEALRQLLPLAREVGLPYVEITTDPDNLASQRVVEANGGALVEHITKHATSGGGPALLYRVTLD